MQATFTWPMVVLQAAILLTACNSQDPHQTASAESRSAAGAQFATAQDVISEINQLSGGGAMRCRDLAPMIYAETPFQRTWVDFLTLVGRAEDLQDAVEKRFGEPIDPKGGDIRIHLSFHNPSLVTQDDQRAEAAVESADESLKRIMLVKIGSKWWISGYTWEHALSDAKKAELPKRTLTYQVEADIGPALAARIRSGEFATIGDLRSAYRDALMTYFQGHPDIYQQITGKPFRRP